MTQVGQSARQYEIGVVFPMTPETYMRRFHNAETDDCCPLTAEELFPVAEAYPYQSETCSGAQTQENEGQRTCCCKSSMEDALRLLCGNALGSLVDFDAFFFLTNSLAVGSALSAPGDDTDNITTPTASLRRFSPCNCDLLEVGGTAYFAVPDDTTVALESVNQLTLCALKAVAFQISEADCPRDCDDTNYRRAVRAIRRAIRAEGGDTGACGLCQAHCDCDNCCCAQGILQELSTRNLSRLATLTAGPLVLQNVTVLGSIGSVLVMASEALNRFYLVCANAVESLG